MMESKKRMAKYVFFMVCVWLVVSPSSSFAQKPVYIESYFNDGTHVIQPTSFVFYDSVIIIPLPTVDYRSTAPCMAKVIRTNRINWKNEIYLAVEAEFANKKQVRLLLGPQSIFVWYDREEIIFIIDLYLMQKAKKG